MTTGSIPDFIEGTEALHWIAFGKLVSAENVKKQLTVKLFEPWGVCHLGGLLEWLEHVVDREPLAGGDYWTKLMREQNGIKVKALRKQHKATNSELLAKLRETIHAEAEWQQKLDEAEQELFKATRTGKIELLGQRVARRANPAAVDFTAVPFEFYLHPVAIDLTSNRLTFDYRGSYETVFNRIATWTTDYANLRMRFDDVKRLWPVHAKDRRLQQLSSGDSCRKWIEAMPRDPVRRKADLLSEAKTLFPELSKRGFDKAWANAAPLSWRKRGSKIGLNPAPNSR